MVREHSHGNAFKSRDVAKSSNAEPLLRAGRGRGDTERETGGNPLG